MNSRETRRTQNFLKRLSILDRTIRTKVSETIASHHIELWHIGLSPWIIQDGNYEDFICGQVADFALEFYAPHGLRQVEKQKPRAKWLAEDHYRIAAEVVHAGHLPVLDFGLRAYENYGTPFRKGSMVEGEIYLGIDPSLYFESLSKNPLMPALIYRWRIDQILRVSAPLVDGKGPDGKRALVPDVNRKRNEVVNRTDAWGDGSNTIREGAKWVEYVLICTMTDAEARRVRRPGGSG